MEYSKSIIKLANSLAIKYANKYSYEYGIIKSWITNGDPFSLSDQDIDNWIKKNPILNRIDYNVLNTVSNIGRDKLLIIDRAHEFGSPCELIYLVSKSPQINSIITPAQSYLLLETDKIPRMYLSAIRADDWYGRDTTMSQDVDIKQSSNFWLRDVLKEVIGDYDLNQRFKELIEDNKEEIEKINKYKNIAYPPLLGRGADGPAYLIARNISSPFESETEGSVVVKFCTSVHPYEKAIESMTYLHKYPEFARTEARIYDVGKLNPTTSPIYFIIMEKMSPVTSVRADDYQLRRIYEYIAKEINEKDSDKFKSLKKIYNKIIHSPQKYEKQSLTLKDYIRNMVINYSSNIIANFDARRLRKTKENFGLNNDWLEQFIEEIIMKYLTSRTDLHFGNLGVTSYGQLRYFDPAHEDWYSQINV